jgi:hypothetical protein
VVGREREMDEKGRKERMTVTTVFLAPWNK